MPSASIATSVFDSSEKHHTIAPVAGHSQHITLWLVAPSGDKAQVNGPFVDRCSLLATSAIVSSPVCLLHGPPEGLRYGSA